MTHGDLTAQRWRDLSDEAALRAARTIARENDCELVELVEHEFADRRHRLALFDRAGLRMSLVPSDRVRLGYSGDRFVPSPDQAADFAGSVAEFELPDLAEFVDAMTSPERVAELPALLVGVEALEPCREAVAVDDPRVLAVAASDAAAGSTGIVHKSPAGGLYVEFDDTGAVRSAQVVGEVSPAEALCRATDLGVRAASPDEWEYACGAGATTLFRWGDDTPSGTYPFDSDTGPHREPNLWGLHIAQDPYRHEFTSDPLIVCGGDGGSANCGGIGYFIGWLTLATAFRDNDFGKWLNSPNGYVDSVLIRPVVEIS